MFHRHLTLERYELALEEGGRAAAAMRRQAAGCPVCSEALAQAPLGPRLAAWAAPEWTDAPVDWEAALKRAIAPNQRAPERRRIPFGRPLLVAAALIGLLLVTALPASAHAGPDSVLYPVRGAEENVRWGLTPRSDRAAMETDLVSAYLWQARTSAARHDDRGYDAAMARFFFWADRLRTDIGSASPEQRAASQSALAADRSLTDPLTSSGPDLAQAQQARSMIENVQAESEAGDDGHRGSGSGGPGPSPSANPTAQPTSEDGGGTQGGGSGSGGGGEQHGSDGS